MKLKDVVDKIVTEIKRIRQGKYGVSYSDIVNYILGHGDLAFNFQGEKGLKRGEIIGNLSGQELSKIIGWCYIKIGKIGNNEFRLEIDTL